MKLLLLIMWAALVLVGCASSTPTPMPAASPVPNPTIQRELDRHLRRLANNQQFSGVALVARGDEILLHKAYGLADAEKETRNTTETRIQLASVAKTLTATAIMKLVEEGKLNLHAPISTYLSDVPDAWRGITAHHLLSHTSGIPEYFEFDEFDVEKNLTPDEIIRVAKEYPLDFEPGAEFEYSNTGYVLLGKLIEMVSGKSYGEYLREAIFAPAGMNATGGDDPNAPLAIGYVSAGAPAEVFPITNRLGDGDLLATAEDLYEFSRALDGDKILSQSSRETMFTPIGKNNYGYGWEVQDWKGRRVVAHSGRINGFSSEFMRFPEDGVTIVLLSNLESFDAAQTGWELAEMIFG